MDSKEQQLRQRLRQKAQQDDRFWSIFEEAGQELDNMGKHASNLI